MTIRFGEIENYFQLQAQTRQHLTRTYLGAGFLAGSCIDFPKPSIAYEAAHVIVIEESRTVH